MLWKALDRYSKDMEVLKGRGVQILETPPAVLQAQLDAWTKVIAKLGGENPFFKKVVDSQMAWAKRTLAYEKANTPNRQMAMTHFKI
jgi:TRAP-type mannitol/chloroaromatic compound transport system substrate-binding protein